MTNTQNLIKDTFYIKLHNKTLFILSVLSAIPYFNHLIAIYIAAETEVFIITKCICKNYICVAVYAVTAQLITFLKVGSGPVC
jgi:hypothetical protein